MSKLKRDDFRPASEWVDALDPDRRKRIEADARAMAEETAARSGNARTDS